MRFYNFKSVELVHIDVGSAMITGITRETLAYKSDRNESLTVDLEECARIYQCLRQIEAFPPRDEMDWGTLIDAVPDFSTQPIGWGAVVGLRGAADDPPWFQFLNRRRTQFEFRDYDHIQSVLLEPLFAAGRWHTYPDLCTGIAQAVAGDVERQGSKGHRVMAGVARTIEVGTLVGVMDKKERDACDGMQ